MCLQLIKTNTRQIEIIQLLLLYHFKCSTRILSQFNLFFGMVWGAEPRLGPVGGKRKHLEFKRIGEHLGLRFRLTYNSSGECRRVVTVNNCWRRQQKLNYIHFNLFGASIGCTYENLKFFRNHNSTSDA